MDSRGHQLVEHRRRLLRSVERPPILPRAIALINLVFPRQITNLVIALNDEIRQSLRFGVDPRLNIGA
jgi:hypothetical protein